MTNFDIAIKVLLDHEGSGYVDDDKGRGPSKYGITLATARACGLDWTAEDIKNLTTDGAQDFYHHYFWMRFRLYLLQDADLATRVFELVVNEGPAQSIKLLQRAIGVKDDGVLGPVTSAAANGLPAGDVIAKLKDEARVYYTNLATMYPEKYAADLPGWIARFCT